MAKRLTDKVLKEIEIVGMLKERYRVMEKNNPEHFMDTAETLRASYKNNVEPVLRPFARYYPTIKFQMQEMDEIYDRQMELRAKPLLEAIPEAERYRQK
jgi:PHD/YefM family antitoxin component YafN of YafNO toxin-antitoxin module